MQATSKQSIQLREWETSQTIHYFSWEDACYLEEHFSKELSLIPTREKNQYLLSAKQYIGSIVVSGREIIIQPKIRNSNIIYMLSYAWGLPRLPRGTAGYEDIKEIFEFIVHLYTLQLEALLAGGMYKSYKEVEENLGFIRGRMVVNETLRQNPGLQHMNVCRYSEFTEDVLENQILKYTTGMLLGRKYRNKQIRPRLYRCFLQMEQVSPERPSSQDFGRLVYTRLNTHYRRLHNLCNLLINHTSFTNEKGNVIFSSFLLDMNKLFEEFIGRYLEEKLSKMHGLRVLLQAREHLDTGRKILMKPDIVITKDNKPVLVMDTKYKRLDVGQVKHADIYQIYAYCSTMKVNKGVLIYGEGEGDRYQTKVPETGLDIETIIFNGSGGIVEFKRECKKLLGYVAQSLVIYNQSPHIMVLHSH